MATKKITKFTVLNTNVAAGKHVWGTHTFKCMLTNTAPVIGNTIKANVTEISAANGYAAGGVTVTATVVRKSATLIEIRLKGPSITASGAVGPFRYLVFYNDTQSSPVKPLIAFIDLGAAKTLANTNKFKFDDIVIQNQVGNVKVSLFSKFKKVLYFWQGRWSK